jgi:hypothetical protein
MATMLSLARRSDTDTSKYAASTVLPLVTSLEDIDADGSAEQRSDFQVSAVVAQALHGTKFEMLKSVASHSSSVGSGRPA